MVSLKERKFSTENKMINFILIIKSREALHPGDVELGLTSDKKQENYYERFHKCQGFRHIQKEI